LRMVEFTDRTVEIVDGRLQESSDAA
jgi:hypothetical protein